jgi:hypothetical protein
MLATSFSPVTDGPFTLNTVVEYLLSKMKVRGLKNNPRTKSPSSQTRLTPDRYRRKRQIPQARAALVLPEVPQEAGHGRVVPRHRHQQGGSRVQALEGINS